MTIQGAYLNAVKMLGMAGIETPQLDAALLLSHILDINRSVLITKYDELLNDHDYKLFQMYLKRRVKGECAAYITGHKEFRYLDLIVTKDVLVPRPDTETLVEAALKYIDLKQNIAMLDICTGSGAVALSLKQEAKSLSVTASDISFKALETAKKNAVRNNFKDCINFIQSDVFENINDEFDIIVSNPPYIPSKQIETLKPEVQNEPRIALDGGIDGLQIINRIIEGSKERLKKNGVLLLEAATGQMSAITLKLKENQFKDIVIYNDLANRARVIGGIYEK